STIPIVFGYGVDPVRYGHVASLSRPGGNTTGMTSLSSELYGKQLGLLHELLPHTSHFAALSNPQNMAHASIMEAVQSAAPALGKTIEILSASTGDEIDAAFARVADEKSVQGLLVSADPFFFAQRVQIAILAARHAVPTIYPFREAPEAGGLMSYG